MAEQETKQDRWGRWRVLLIGWSAVIGTVRLGWELIPKVWELITKLWELIREIFRH